jgi:hypothetical protein
VYSTVLKGKHDVSNLQIEMVLKTEICTSSFSNMNGSQQRPKIYPKTCCLQIFRFSITIAVFTEICILKKHCIRFSFVLLP